MKRWLWTVYALLAVVGFTAWKYLITIGPTRFGSSEPVPTSGNYCIVAFGYLVTLLGVLLGSVYRQLRARADAGTTSVGDPRLFFGTVFTSVEFWMSMCGSPIVYALLWKSVGGGDLSALTIIALENGFCCTTILSNFVKAGGQQPYVG
jgi:hypothetical protein